MRKIIIALAIITITIACATKNSLVKYRTIELEERVPLIDGDPDSISYHIELFFTELTDYSDKNVLKNVKKELSRQFFEIDKKEFPLDPLVNFKSLLIDLTQNYRKEGIELKREYQNMNHMLNYEFIKHSKIVYNKNKILIVEIETYAYSGGAHGIGNKSYLHFDMKSGSTFTTDEIFNKGVTKKINQIVQKRCNQKHQKEDFMVFEDAKPQINENFYFDKKNLYFVYNPYEIAPYSSGYMVIDIPIKELDGLINNNGPIAFLN